MQIFTLILKYLFKRSSMLHLLKTWNGLFPPDKIQQIESITQGTSVTVQKDSHTSLTNVLNQGGST